MTQASGHSVRLDTKAESDRLIPWIETDPRRAPLRNDVITALQFSVAPALFWYVFFTGTYEPRTAIQAAVFVMLIIFAVSFVVTWARMSSARRASPTIRGPRSRLRFALFVAVVFGVLTGVASLSTYPDRTVEILLGAAAALSAAVIVLVLESYAVNVPASDREYEKIQRAKYDTQ